MGTPSYGHWHHHYLHVIRRFLERRCPETVESKLDGWGEGEEGIDMEQGVNSTLGGSAPSGLVADIVGVAAESS